MTGIFRVSAESPNGSGRPGRAAARRRGVRLMKLSGLSAAERRNMVSAKTGRSAPERPGPGAPPLEIN